MKTPFACLAISVLLVLVAAPALAEEDEEDLYFIQGTRVPFEISVPWDWYEIQGTGDNVLASFRPDREELYPFLAITLEMGNLEHDLTPRRALSYLLFQHAGARLVESEWRDLESGGRYMVARCAWSSPLGEIGSLMAFVPHGRDTLIISGVALAEDFEDYETLFSDVISSLRLKAAPRREPREPEDPEDRWIKFF